MKRNSTTVKVLLLAGVAFVFMSNRGGSPGGKSGSTTDVNTCASGNGCHGPKTPMMQEALSGDFPSSGYAPGTNYKISVKPTNSGTTVWGFECMAEDASGNAVGVFANNDDSNIKNDGLRVTHKFASTTFDAGSAEWVLDWTAPASGTGEVTFYVAVLAANGNGNTGGDELIIDTLVVSEGQVNSISDLIENDIRLFPNPVVNELHIDSKSAMVGGLLEVFNSKGELVISSTIENSVTVSSLASGMYYAKISQGEKVITKTFVKQ